MQQLLAFLFTACTLITDRSGRHFARHQLPDEAARSFVQACAELDPFNDTKRCAAFLLYMSALESGWRLHISGDHGHAHGPFQEWTGGEPATWLEASRHYLSTVSRAMRVCPEQVIAPLAGERCGASAVHQARWAKIQMLVDSVPGEP